MRLRGLGRLRRFAGQWWLRMQPRALILAYHRVAALDPDPLPIAVSPQNFQEQLEVINRFYHPLSLQAAVSCFQKHQLPARMIVLTFDDGYADNLHQAKPLLERYDIPATVFVTAGAVGRAREFWWDELDRLLLQPGTLPEKLHLDIGGKTYQWELAEATHYSDVAYQRNRLWNTLKPGSPSPRHCLYRSLSQLLRCLPEGEQWKILDELLAWTGMEPKGRPTHRALTPDEVYRLAEGELVEVGAHTITHPVLSALPLSSQWNEIRGSKARLEQILGRSVNSFAYPYGTQSDYTAETAVVVREAGFTCACSNFEGVVWRGTDRFQLPRVLVRDWDGEEFAMRLSRWFHD